MSPLPATPLTGADLPHVTPVTEVSFAAHGNPSELAELEYFLSLPATTALLRTENVAGRNARGVHRRSIPVPAASVVLVPAVTGDQVLNMTSMDPGVAAHLVAYWQFAGYRQSAGGLRDAQADGPALVTTGIVLSPLYQRREEAYEPVNDVHDITRGSELFPYLFSAAQVAPGYTQEHTPRGYQPVDRDTAYQRAGTSCALFGAISIGCHRSTARQKEGPLAVPQLADNAPFSNAGAEFIGGLSLRFPRLLLTSISVASGGTRGLVSTYLFRDGQRLHATYGHAAFIDIPGRRRFADLIASIARTVLDVYLNGTGETPTKALTTLLAQRVPLSPHGSVLAEYPWKTFEDQGFQFDTMPYTPPLAAAELKRHREGVGPSATLAANGARLARTYGEAMRESQGYRWHPLAAAVLAQGASALSVLLPAMAPSDVQPLLQRARGPSGFSALDAMVASQTAQGNLVFDARKLTDVARTVFEDGTGALALALAVTGTGCFMQGISLSAYLCLSEDPRLKRPLMLDGADVQEEARRLRKNSPVFNGSPPAKSHAGALQAVAAYRGSGGAEKGWVTPEYAGLLAILQAQAPPRDAALEHLFGKPLGVAWSHLKEAMFGRKGLPKGAAPLRNMHVTSECYLGYRALDSALLTVASGHPDGIRTVVQEGVPWRFVATSLARDAAELREFAAEFGLSRFSVANAAGSLLDPEGLPRGRTDLDALTGRHGTDLRAVHRALRIEMLMRGQIQACAQTRPEAPATPVVDRPRLDVL